MTYHIASLSTVVDIILGVQTSVVRACPAGAFVADRATVIGIPRKADTGSIDASVFGGRTTLEKVLVTRANDGYSPNGMAYDVAAPSTIIHIGLGICANAIIADVRVGGTL